ncbi:MAG: hypothetical protein M3Q98_08295 [Actinomycetota bacterium]|nr:hypothetical protein [Actinomycetota bacterium]
MSNPNGPVRRRRIAGESKPAETRRKVIPRSPRKPAAKTAPKPVAPTKPPVSKPPVSKAGVSKPTVSKPPVPRDGPAPSRAASAAAPATSRSPVGARISLPPRSEWRWFIPLTLVAIAAVVFGAVFAVKGVSDYREQQGIEAANASASAAAGKAAEAIFSFRYDKLDQHLTESKALMTPKFKKEFDKIAPALTELAPQRKIEVQARSRNAAALECGNECSPTKSSILVFIDQARLVGDSKVPTVFGNRIVVSMVKSDGAWLVDDIKAL